MIDGICKYVIEESAIKGLFTEVWAGIKRVVSHSKASCGQQLRGGSSILGFKIQSRRTFKILEGAPVAEMKL